MNKREWKARRWREKAAKRRKRWMLAAYDRLGRLHARTLDTPARQWFTLTVPHWRFAAARAVIDITGLDRL